MKLIDKLKKRAESIKFDIIAISLSIKDKRTPWYAKCMIAFTISYAFSPVDLIPDFIPVLGYLDDLVILPILITASIKLIPEDVLADCRFKAQENIKITQRSGWITAIFIIIIWLTIIVLILSKIFDFKRNN